MASTTATVVRLRIVARRTFPSVKWIGLFGPIWIGPITRLRLHFQQKFMCTIGRTPGWEDQRVHIFSLQRIERIHAVAHLAVESKIDHLTVHLDIGIVLMQIFDGNM